MRPPRWLAPLMLALAVPAAAGPRWLPDAPVHPRDLADPGEPRFGITVDEAGDSRYDAALGLPVPLVAFGTDRPVGVVLEVGSFFVLGRDGSKFPLHTFDGVFGLGVEGRSGPWHGRLRWLHRSAHLADGDSAVAYPPVTWSRELLTLEGGRRLGDAFVYARVGTPTHAVPADDGLHLAAGFVWESAPGRPGWFLAGHLGGEAARDWRFRRSLVGGVVLGDRNRVRLGLRLFDGPAFEGQKESTDVTVFGFELQVAPGAGAADDGRP